MIAFFPIKLNGNIPILYATIPSILKMNSTYKFNRDY